MSDWQVGDLAVCVDAGIISCKCGELHSGLDTPAGPMRVERLETWAERGDQACNCLILVFGCKQGLAIRFRKIHPDEQEPCEEEFVTLLNNSKPVSLPMVEA